MLENAKKRFGRTAHALVVALQKERSIFDRKRIAEMSSKCKHLNRKCSKCRARFTVGVHRELDVVASTLQISPAAHRLDAASNMKMSIVGKLLRNEK